MRRLLPIWGLAAAAVTGPAAGADMPSLEPVPLFTAICTQGGGRLPAADVAQTRYLVIPADARVALGFGLAAGRGMAAGMMEPLASRDVPNTVLAIGRGHDRFLLPSISDKSGALAASCSVVWRGLHYAEARRAAADIAGMPDGGSDTDASPIAGAHIYGVRGRGYALAASEISGWTVLRMTPDTSSVPSAGTAYRRTATVPASGLVVHDNGHGEVVVKPAGNN